MKKMKTTKLNNKKIEEKFIREISNMSNDELIDWINNYLSIKEKRKIIKGN